MNVTVTTNSDGNITDAERNSSLSSDAYWWGVVEQTRTVRAVYIWVFAAIGFPGNAACLVTVLSMPVTTATFYVALLAAADSSALLTKLVSHQLSTYQAFNVAACYLNDLPVLTGAYANWVLVLICFERFFSVCWPLKKHLYFTKRRSYISAGVLGLILFCLFFPTVFSYQGPSESRKGCLYRAVLLNYRYYFWDRAMSSALYFFLPFVLVAIFIGITIAALYRHRRNRQNITISLPGQRDEGNAERSISIMLVCAGFIFLLTTLPMCLYHLKLQRLYNKTVFKEKVQDFLLYQVVTILSESTHAINFIIYFISAARFRSSFRALLIRCPCIKRMRSASIVTSSDDTHLTQFPHDSHTDNYHKAPDAKIATSAGETVVAEESC